MINSNLFPSARAHTGEYWPEVVAVRTERNEVRTKMTVGQYSLVRLEQARLVSSLLYGTHDTMLILNLPAFKNRKIHSLWPSVHGKGPYGENPTKKKPIRTLGFAWRLPCLKILLFIVWKGSLEVNPSVLIGSFLVGISPYGQFPWIRS